MTTYDTNISINATTNNIEIIQHTNDIIISQSNQGIIPHNHELSDITNINDLIITYPQLSNNNSVQLNVSKRIASAWINFNAVGIVNIRDSFNISSIIDQGVGHYTVNFTYPFINTNYTFTAWARDFNTDVYIINTLGAKSNSVKTTSSVEIIFNDILNGLNYDSSECNLVFFGVLNV